MGIGLSATPLGSSKFLRLKIMETSSQTFLTILTQISVTTIVLLVSGMIAFSVYKQERKIAYEDEITKERINIRSYLNDIKGRWNISKEGYVPIEFESKYKSLIKNKSIMDLWVQAFIGAEFDEIGHTTEVTKSLELIQPDYFKNEYWIYPVKLFILSKMVNVLNRKYNYSEANLTKSFPATVSEIGYEEWENDFKLLYTNRNLIERLINGNEKSRFVKGLNSYITKVNDKQFAEYYSRAALEDIKTLLANINKINDCNKLIQEKDFISKSSSSIKLNYFWLITFISLSIITGILVPLITINYNIKISPFVGIGLLTLTTISLIFSFALFAKQITSSKIDISKEYLSARRYQPLFNVLKEHSESIKKYNVLDISFLQDIVLDGKIEGMKEEDISKISEYIILIEEYNLITYEFGDYIQSNLKEKFNFVKVPPSGEGYSEFPIALWFNSQKRTEYFKRVLNKKSDIGFDLKGYYWSRNLVWMPCGKWTGSEGEFIICIDDIADNIYNKLNNKNYFKVIEDIIASNSSLINRLEIE